MARENRGLQIALIVFVLLTILFSVTAFTFFRRAKQESVRQEAMRARAAAQAAQDARSRSTAEPNRVEEPVSAEPRSR